jgi:hemerythrin-like domain-containing protein
VIFQRVVVKGARHNVLRKWRDVLWAGALVATLDAEAAHANQEPVMSHDDFESECYRVERVLELLKHAADRLDVRAHVPLTVLQDAIAFVDATEEIAYEAAQADDSEPALSACLEQHMAARRPLVAMRDALRSLEHGDASAAARFARSAREYVELRRAHLRLDDRLFARASNRRRALDELPTPVDSVEGAATRRLYDRLVEAAAILDIGAPTAFPRRPTRRVGTQ